MNKLIPPVIDERSWDLLNELTDLIAPHDNLEEALQVGLRFALEAVQHPAGAIWVGPENEPEYLLFAGVPYDWHKALETPGSNLYQAAQHIIRTGQSQMGNPLAGLAGGVPLPSKAGVQGALLLAGLTSAERALPLLQLLAVPMGRTAMLRRARKEASRRSREQAAYKIMAAVLGKQSNLGDAAQALLKESLDVLEVEAGALVIFHESSSGSAMKKVVWSGQNRTEQSIIPYDRQHFPGAVGECVCKMQPIMLNEIGADSVFRPEVDGLNGLAIHALLCVPLVSQGQTLGALTVYNPKNGAFANSDREFLVLIASAIADHVRNANLVEQLKLTSNDLEVSRLELLRSRNTLRGLFDNIPASLYIVDQQYNVIAVNKSRASRVQRRPSQIVGNKCYEALFGRAAPCPGCLVRETLFHGQLTHRLAREGLQTEQWTEWEINTYPIVDSQNQPVQAILMEQDVTEKRLLETSLAQSEKLAAVGQLAAGVAHEINNPLAAIIANAQMLKRDLANSDPDTLDMVDLIELAGTRASQVVRNLLGFARKEKYNYHPTDLNETIRNALVLLQHELVSRPVNLILDLSDDMPAILASRDHLQGVWSNLVLNAIDALEGKPGEVRIGTRYQSNEFRIVISDTGKGIPADQISRIFEPFFTTKEVGRGTGLGLSLCHRIIKQHGGQVLVDSQVGKGTQFLVTLPAQALDPGE